MKNNMLRSIVLCIMIAVFCLSISLAFAVSDAYYPGPEDKPDEPATIVTPPSDKTTPKPEDPVVITPVPEKPTNEPAPTPTPRPYSYKTPEPTETPEPELPEYSLTIFYKFPDGSEAAVPYVNIFKTGEVFQVSSPSIPGYLASKPVVSSKMTPHNQEIVVWFYKPGLTIIEDYETPLGLGNVVINIGDCYE